MSNPTDERRAGARDSAYADAAAAWQMLIGVGQAARMMPERRVARPGSVQFTLITGFLGSGKTTLINRLLSGTHGRRLAVIVNDFGAINIDTSLISQRDRDTISLTNGCACCSMARGLTETLLTLTEQAEPPEAILLEASGIAEPQPIVHVALTNPALSLNCVVTLLDTETVLAHADDARFGTIVTRQVSGADLVVLNKTDLAAPAVVDAVTTWVRGHAAGAAMLQAREADVPIELVLGHQASRTERAPETLAPPSSAQSGTTASHPFRSWSFSLDEALSSDRIRKLSDALPDGILRAKGTLYLADSPDHRHIFQRVGRRWRLSRDIAWSAEARRSELVFITADNSIREETLRACVNDCIADQSD